MKYFPELEIDVVPTHDSDDLRAYNQLKVLSLFGFTGSICRRVLELCDEVNSRTGRGELENRL